MESESYPPEIPQIEIGGLYDFLDYKAMLESAGFANVQDFDLGPIKAVKPGGEG